MATTGLTKENFGSTIERTDVVLVDFWASWCGPCRQFGPILEEVPGRHNGVVFGKVDTEAEQDLAFTLDIQSIPAIMAFRTSVLVLRHSGLLNGAQVDNFVKRVKELDPEKLKEKVREGSVD